MKRAVFVFIHLSVLIFGGVYEDGLFWLMCRSSESGGMSLVERVRVSRSLSVCLGMDTGLSALPSLCSSSEDLLTDLIECALNRGRIWRHRGCFMSDGSCSCEPGGHGDICATLSAVGFLLDFGVASSEVLPSCKDYIVRWLGMQESSGGWRSGLDAQQLRYHLESLVVLGLCRRLGMLSSTEEERLWNMGSVLLAEISARWVEEGESMSVYDSALLIRGFGLLGRMSEVQWLVSVVEGGAEASGCWEDSTVGSAAAVTSAVVEALNGADAVSRELVVDAVFESSDACGDGVGVYTYHIQEDATGPWSVLIRDGTGDSLGVYWAQSASDGLQLDTSVFAPGRYEAVVRLWENDGAVQAGESVCFFDVGPWFKVDEINITGLGVEQVLYAGEAVVIQPMLACRYGGNVVKTGVVSGMVCGPDGEAFAEFPVLRWRGSSGNGSFTQQAGVWEGVLADVGYYDVHVVLSVDGVEYVAHRLMYVGARSDVVVDNHLSESDVTDAAVSGTVVLHVAARNVGAVAGLPVSFSAPERLELTDSASEVRDIRIDGIVSGDGKTLLSGWLVVRVDYGGCVGGATVHDYGGHGSLTIHEIVEGRCNLGYRGGGSGVKGPVPLNVYAGHCSFGSYECHDKIGVIELILE